MFRYLALALFVATARAECPNACSGHGDCANYDMCMCYRNWEGADCSLRTCPFGLAHVDSPKGDLDMSADSLSGPTETVLIGSIVYPYGTQEQFPNMTDSRDNTLENTAHYYMECSNKGICDRKVGECDCFDGYEGSSCQRASCPNDCSGHGTCEHIKTLAALDFGNIYDLWDAEMTMGCLCDAGYSGPDCSSKDCKYGIDPLYIDDEATARVEAVSYQIHTANVLAGTSGYSTEGTYALKFYDVFGEDYVTEPIEMDADCYTVEDALDGLPNTVIPDDSIHCSPDVVHGTSSYSGYSLTFRGNPGYLKELFVDTYLDGHVPTIYEMNNGAINTYDHTVDIFNKGMTGEFVDYFATQCRHVYTQIKANDGSNGVITDGTYKGATVELNSGYVLDFTTSMNTGGEEMAIKLMKQCLGDSDGVVADNVEVYDWDYGSIVYDTVSSVDYYMMSSYPHAIKLVEVNPSDDYDGGMYFLTWWAPSTSTDGTNFNEGQFIIANNPTADYVDEDNTYAVYVTDGVVERVIFDRAVHNNDDIEGGDKGTGEINPVGKSTDPRVTAFFEQYSNILYTSYDTACETAYANVEPCLDKGDMLFVIDSRYLTESHSPVSQTLASDFTASSITTASYESGNLYTIEKIYKEDPTDITHFREDRFRIVLDKHIPFDGTTRSNLLTGASSNETYVGVVNLFKFSPATTGNYEFVAQCSNRGTCDDGQCECFKGYTNDNCDVQSSLAV